MPVNYTTTIYNGKQDQAFSVSMRIYKEVYEHINKDLMM
uniref:Uncharacterized protein n=1 Tax=Rhizophora mucronata TaxID=61149 RepID=A0A2P2QWS2_RHIMU